MDQSSNGNNRSDKNGVKGKIIPPRSNRPTPLSVPGLRRAKPAYPFYGIYSSKRVPAWILRKKNRRPPSGGKITVLVLILTLAIGFVLTIGLFLAIAGLGSGAAILTYSSYAKGLSLDKEYALTFETTRIYDRNGVLLFEKQPEAGARDFISFKEIPKVLVDATVAAEDPTFFENQGVDAYAILRAVYINLSKQGSSGASTITQQVARLLYLPPEERFTPTFERKFRELILATMITGKFTKEQVLEKYLNNIYYGNLAYGIEAAAEGYFGKTAKELTLAEASMLAGLPQLPSQYDPTINYDLARLRQKRVLELMVKYEKITEQEAADAYAYDIKAHLQDRRAKTNTMRAPHFVNYILSELASDTGLKQLTDAGVLISPEDWELGGFDIYTTIDVRLVDEAEKIARKRVDELKQQKASNAALVAMRPSTGEVLSMVGSIDFYNNAINGQFNAAVSYRQPGSSIKPVTYAAAMTKGWTAATVIADTQTNFPSGNGQAYSPVNSNGKFLGPVTLRNSLGSSLNVPAVKTLQFDGIQYMMDLAKDMGVQFQKGPEFYGLTLTLGGGEVRLLDLTGAYSVFANAGKKVDPVFVLKITKRDKLVYEFKPEDVKPRQILSSQISYVITNILSDNEARLLVFSRSNPLTLSRPAAAKTGTTNDFKDSWTVGYTPDLTVGVWIGNNDNSSMLAVAGSIGGGYVWHDFMETVYGTPELKAAIEQKDQPLKLNFDKPDGLVTVKVCVDSGLLPNDNPIYDCPDKRDEIFPVEFVPKTKSTLHQRVKVPKKQLPIGVTTPLPNTSPTGTPLSNSGDINIYDPTYCVAGDTYPPDMVEERIFFNYPPELKEWGIRNNRLPPPTQPCLPYVAPIATLTPDAFPTAQPGTVYPGLTNPAIPTSGSVPVQTPTTLRSETPTAVPTTRSQKPLPTPTKSG
jgi:membrane peptidoglycan carboxypeptidase